MTEHISLCVSAAPRDSAQKTGRDRLPSGQKPSPQAAGQPGEAPGLSAGSEYKTETHVHTQFHPGFNIRPYTCIAINVA